MADTQQEKTQQEKTQQEKTQQENTQQENTQQEVCVTSVYKLAFMKSFNDLAMGLGLLV